MKRTVLFLKIKKSHFCHLKSSSVNQNPVLSTENLTTTSCQIPSFEKDSSVTQKDSSVNSKHEFLWSLLREHHHEEHINEYFLNYSNNPVVVQTLWKCPILFENGKPYEKSRTLGSTCSQSCFENNSSEN